MIRDLIEIAEDFMIVIFLFICIPIWLIMIAAKILGGS